MSRVEEVRSSFSATHGERSTIISNSSFHGGIEGTKPVSFFSARIPNFGSKTTPRAHSNAQETSGLFTALGSFRASQFTTLKGRGWFKEGKLRRIGFEGGDRGRLFRIHGGEKGREMCCGGS